MVQTAFAEIGIRLPLLILKFSGDAAACRRSGRWQPAPMKVWPSRKNPRPSQKDSPDSHGLSLGGKTVTKLVPHGARIGALSHQNETGQHQHIQANAQQEDEDEVLFRS